MELQKLLNEFDAYLDEEVETEVFSSQLYRGDDRDLAEITAAGGFFPKKMGEVSERNRAMNHMGNLLWPALQYHAVQRERLVINNIPIGNIHL